MKKIVSFILAISVMLSVLAVPASAASYTDYEKQVIEILFSDSYYSANNPDVVNCCGCTHEALFSHYLEYGIREGRRPSIFFDAPYYLNLFGDLLAAFGPDNYQAALLHFVHNGISEKRVASKEFNIHVYCEYGDLRAAFADNWLQYYQHFRDYGSNEKRKCNNIGLAVSFYSENAPVAGTSAYIGDGIYAKITTALNPNMALNVQYAPSSGIGKICLDPYSSEGNETFRFVWNASAQAYTIVPVYNGSYSINNYGPNPNDGDQACAYQSATMYQDTHSLWRLIKSGPYYIIQCVGTTFCLDVDHGNTSTGTRINCYHRDNSDNQLFVITAVSGSVSQPVNDNPAPAKNPVCYVQKQEKWKNVSYADNSHRGATAYSSACSVFALLTCITDITGRTFNDDEIKEWIRYSLNNYRCDRNIASSGKVKSSGVVIKNTVYYSSSKAENGKTIGKMIEHLRNNGAVYFSVQSSSGGHVMAILDHKTENGKELFLVADTYPTATRLGDNRSLGWCTMDDSLDLHSVDSGKTIVTKGSAGFMLLGKG